MQETYDGNFGFFLMPSEQTKAQARRLAEELIPNAEYRVGVGYDAHITLYSCFVTNMQVSFARQILYNLRDIPQPDTLRVERIGIYGGKFLFWDLEKNDYLELVHSRALRMASLIDHLQVARAEREGLELSEAERANIRKFGHPLTKDLYRPHITLGYDSNGLDEPNNNTSNWFMPRGSYEVCYGEIGEYGTVKRVISLT